MQISQPTPDAPFPQAQANGASEQNGKSDQNDKAEQYDYDFFAIGGGTGGVRAARWSAMNYGKFYENFLTSFASRKHKFMVTSCFFTSAPFCFGSFNLMSHSQMV